MKETFVGSFLGMVCFWFGCMFVTFSIPWPDFMPHPGIAGNALMLFTIVAISSGMLAVLLRAFRGKDNDRPVMRRGLIGGYFAGYLLWFTAVTFLR